MYNFYPTTVMKLLLSVSFIVFLQSFTWSKPMIDDTSQSLTYAYSTGVRINYEKIGHGYKKVVLLNGFETSSHTWDDIKGLFPKDEFTLLILDLKGYDNFSEQSDKNDILREQTKIVVQFVMDIDADTLYLIGHSYGGSVALLTQISLLNEKGKPRISKLILIDCKENTEYSFITSSTQIDLAGYNKIMDRCGQVPLEEKPTMTFDKIYSFIGSH